MHTRNWRQIAQLAHVTGLGVIVLGLELVVEGFDIFLHAFDQLGLVLLNGSPNLEYFE
jgi:hypothetical protein